MAKTTAAAFAAMMAGASAFVAPMPQLQSSSVSKMTMMAEKSPSLPFMDAPANLDASMPGYVGFDPLGFSDSFSVDFLREAELKHGRIAMLATVGWVATELGLRLPGKEHDVSTIAAHDAAVEYGAMGQIFMWTSLLEIFGLIALVQMMQGSGRQPGDFGFDPFNYQTNYKGGASEFATKEVNNGRLAMVAFGGMVTQAVLYGGKFPYL